MILNRQNLSENNWNHFKIVPQGHNHCQLSIVNCQFGEAAKFQFICFTVKPTYIKIGVPWHAGFLKNGCLYLPGRIRVQVFDIVQVIGKGGGNFGIESAQAAGGAGHGSGSSFGIGAWQEGHELVGADLGKGISGP